MAGHGSSPASHQVVILVDRGEELGIIKSQHTIALIVSLLTRRETRNTTAHIYQLAALRPPTSCTGFLVTGASPVIITAAQIKEKFSAQLKRYCRSNEGCPQKKSERISSVFDHREDIRT